MGENVTKEEAMKVFATSYPDKRYCRPEEVADLSLFLASDLSSHITGSLVTMNGGQAALGRQTAAVPSLPNCHLPSW